MPVYSHSRLSSYENCPLQYRYRYVDRIRTDFESIEAFMGKKVHETLEHVYGDLDAARAAGVDEAVAWFDRAWSTGLVPGVRVVRPDMQAEDYRRIGERCIRGFWEINYPFQIEPERIIGLELRVDIALDKDRRYRMMGFIDRVQHAEAGVIEIHDYKTSASLPREGSLRYDRQLPLYEMGIRQRFPQTDQVRLIWHYLAHGQTIVETRTREQLDRVRRSCIALIQTLERVHDFPAKKGPLCAWCSYQEMCPEWKTEKPVAPPAFPGGRPEAAAEEAAPSEGAATNGMAADARADGENAEASSAKKQQAPGDSGQRVVDAEQEPPARQAAGSPGDATPAHEESHSQGNERRDAGRVPDSPGKAPSRPVRRTKRDTAQLPLF
ncbi:MAG TPA: PD-(D/E)XK nuclease family protein [Candidatus Saccharimonadales bacterium]|nr:PD-(D/E)XK nuclease family protein [Candidatus Saccharimonadales bacterium]